MPPRSPYAVHAARAPCYAQQTPVGSARRDRPRETGRCTAGQDTRMGGRDGQRTRAASSGVHILASRDGAIIQHTNHGSWNTTRSGPNIRPSVRAGTYSAAPRWRFASVGASMSSPTNSIRSAPADRVGRCTIWMANRTYIPACDIQRTTLDPSLQKRNARARACIASLEQTWGPSVAVQMRRSA